MKVKKSTARMLREKNLEDAEAEADRHLEDLLLSTKKKHLNGGMFHTRQHHETTCQRMRELLKENL